jgi:hypothetical protein
MCHGGTMTNLPQLSDDAQQLLDRVEGLGVLLNVPESQRHKFRRIAGGCKCAFCGQGEDFVAHRVPIAVRVTLADMERDHKLMKQQAAEMDEIDVAKIKRAARNRRSSRTAKAGEV